MNKRLWVIIPGFNEEKYLAKVLKKVSAVTRNVIYVDDGSSDNSAKIAHGLIQHVLVHPLNLGKGAALRTGCDYAFNHLDAEAVIFLDSDDQHDPAEIPKFAEALDRHQVVFGVRKFSTDSMPLSRFLGNKIGSALITLLFGRYIPDIPSGYKALKKRAYQLLRWDALGYEVEMEIAVGVAKKKLSYATVEIETIYHDKEKGMDVLEAINILMQIVKWRITK